MLTVLAVLHLMIVAALIAVVLLQKSEGGGLGTGGGGVMTTRGQANLLTRTTAVLAALFFLTSLASSWVAGHDRKPPMTISIQPAAPGGQPKADGLPQAGGLLDSLKQQDAQPAPQAPDLPASK